MEENFQNKIYRNEKNQNQNKELLSSISLVHDSFMTLQEDLNNINNINTKISNSFEIWIQQLKESFYNAMNSKNKTITFHHCFLSESIKKDIQKVSQNFPKQMNINKIHEDNELNNFLIKTLKEKEEENSNFKKEKNFNDIKEFIEMGNLKEKKIDNLNNSNLIDTIISLGTVLEQSSLEENTIKNIDNLNNNHNNDLKKNEDKNKESDTKKILNAFEKMKKSIENKTLKEKKNLDNIKENNSLKNLINDTEIYKMKLEKYQNSKINKNNNNNNQEKTNEFLSEDINRVKAKMYNSLNTSNELFFYNNNKNNNNHNINNNNKNINTIISNEKNIQTPSFGNLKIKNDISNINKSTQYLSNNKNSNNDFTFSKIKRINNTNNKIETLKKSNPLQNIKDYIENSPMIEEWKNPLSINNYFINNSNLVSEETLIKKINTNKEYNFEREYSITEISSNDSNNDEINEDKYIPEWANDNKYLEEQIRKQNNNNNLENEVFGKFVIENLNLNMIFETMNENYNLRHSTADWKNDNTIKNNNINFINYQNLNENSNLFPQTNRQLHFSNVKNLIKK